MEEFIVHIPEETLYQVGEGLLKDLPELLHRIAPGAHACALISDQRVYALFGSELEHALSRAGLRQATFFITGKSDAQKELEKRSVGHFFDSLALTGEDLCLCVGGGAVCATGGAAAAEFRGGIPCVCIPTGLLPMLELHHRPLYTEDYRAPSATLCDTQLLRSLTAAQRVSGFAQLIRDALVLGEAPLALLREAPLPVERAVTLCLQLKNRRLADGAGALELAVGEQIARTAEEIDQFRLPRGFYLAAGLMTELSAAVRNGLCEEQDAALAAELLGMYGLGTHMPVPLEEVCEALAKRGELRLPVLLQTGRTSLCTLAVDQIAPYFLSKERIL